MGLRCLPCVDSARSNSTILYRRCRLIAGTLLYHSRNRCFRSGAEFAGDAISPAAALCSDFIYAEDIVSSPCFRWWWQNMTRNTPRNPETGMFRDEVSSPKPPNSL